MQQRDKRQEEYAREWLKTQFGILHLCPRFGKIRTALKAIAELSLTPKVLVIYPIETIKKSWEDDIAKWGYNLAFFNFISTASLWKLAEKPQLYDVIVMDEVQLFSPANLQQMKVLIEFGNKRILGLSGTVSRKTAEEIMQTIQLPIVAEYTIDRGILERVITDYEINIVRTNLDDTIKYIAPSKKLPNFKVTEKGRYDYITDKIEQLKKDVTARNEKMVKEAKLSGRLIDYEDYEQVELGFLPLQRMHLIKRSIAKIEVTKKLIKRFQGERLLLFCGLTEVADSFGVPVFHSKDKDLEIRDAFCRGEGDCLATVDMFEAGVTIKPINKAIINSFDSNAENLVQKISRLTGFEYDNPDKKAVVYIVCTNTIERKWLESALEFFDSSKINDNVN